MPSFDTSCWKLITVCDARTLRAAFTQVSWRTSGRSALEGGGLVEELAGIDVTRDEFAGDAHQLFLVLDQVQPHLLLGHFGVAPHRIGGPVDFLIAQVPERSGNGREEHQHREQRCERGQPVLPGRAIAGATSGRTGVSGGRGQGVAGRGSQASRRIIWPAGVGGPSQVCSGAATLGMDATYSQCEMRVRHLKIEKSCAKTPARQRIQWLFRGDNSCPPCLIPCRCASTNDVDAQETREWLDALSAVINAEGPERAHFLLEQLLEEARQHSVDMPFSANTGYVNTIAPDDEERCPGNIEIEERLRAYMRWNAMAMVVKANRHNPADGGDLGGHIGSFASLAHMFGAGFNHFWHAESENHGGDCLYIQGHVSPGVYARAYLEGRLTEEQLLHFRQEVEGKGLSSYPHPKLMPSSGSSRPSRWAWAP